MSCREHLNEVWFSFGSNCGDREAIIHDALQHLKSLIKISVVSFIYETPEIHGVGAPYLNAVMVGMTHLSFEDLNDHLKDLEVNFGRDAECRKAGRVPIDIDIVIWNKTVKRPKDYSSVFFQIGYKDIQNQMSL